MGEFRHLDQVILDENAAQVEEALRVKLPERLCLQLVLQVCCCDQCHVAHAGPGGNQRRVGQLGRAACLNCFFQFCPPSISTLDSFADAEAAEDGIEKLIGDRLAGYLTQRIQGSGEVDGDEVVGKLLLR